MARTTITLCTTFAAMVWLTACGTGTRETTPGDQTAPASRAAPSKAARKNACDLVDRAAIEAIAGQKLDMLHDIQEEDKTVCEMHEPGHNTTLVSVTVYWKGGKERSSAYYNDVPPSWFIKGDVLVEVTAPSFDADKTKAVFLSVSKSAMAQL
jgi:hypothetical protein